MKLLNAEGGSLTGDHLPGISDGSDSVNTGDTCKPLPVSAVTTETSSPIMPQATTSNFIPAVKQSKFVTVNLPDPDYAARYAHAVADAMTMTKSQLQSRYKQEYNCLRSRKQQAKARHIKFADSLKDIRDWLIHLGPIPAKGLTVDRINNPKGYQPNNLRWATKFLQTQNRKVTRWHQLPDGARLTTKQLAKRLGLAYNALYKRLKNGWTLDRLLQQDTPLGLESWKFPPALAQHCEPLYRQRKYHKQHRIDWFIEYFQDVLYNKLEGKWSMPGNAIPSLMEHLNNAREERTEILRQQKEREERSLQELLIIVAPPSPSALGNASPTMTDEDRKRLQVKYSALL